MYWPLKLKVSLPACVFAHSVLESQHASLSFILHRYSMHCGGIFLCLQAEVCLKLFLTLWSSERTYSTCRSLFFLNFVCANSHGFMQTRIGKHAIRQVLEGCGCSVYSCTYFLCVCLFRSLCAGKCDGPCSRNTQTCAGPRV